MKITITGEHNGETKTICVYEYDPLAKALSAHASPNVTDQVTQVIMGEVQHYMETTLKDESPTTAVFKL